LNIRIGGIRRFLQSLSDRESYRRCFRIVHQGRGLSRHTPFTKVNILFDGGLERQSANCACISAYPVMTEGVLEKFVCFVHPVADVKSFCFFVAKPTGLHIRWSSKYRRMLLVSLHANVIHEKKSVN